MNVRSFSFLLCSCLALGACDSGSDETTGGGSTSGGDEGSSTSGTDPTSISASVSDTTPTTDPTTDGESSGSEGSSSGSTSSATSGTTDPTTGDDSSSTGGETGSTTGGETSVTVYDVQDGTVAEGTMVTVEGVVITGLREGVGVFVQEIDGGEYSGVYVDTGDIDLTGFAVGDIVDVSGTTSEDLPSNNPNALVGLTGLVSGDGMGTMTAAGGSMALSPETVDLATLSDPETAEPWESVLVSVSGDLTATTAMNDAMSEFGDFSEFAVEEGEGSIRADDFLYNIFDDAVNFPDFGEGATFTSVSGVLNYSFGNFKVAPRSADEYQGYTAPPMP